MPSTATCCWCRSCTGAACSASCLREGHGGSAFTSEERDFARGLGEEAAQAMANARLYDEVNRLHLGNLKP